MVCPRCISAVSTILRKLDIPYVSVRLGEVELNSTLGPKKKLVFSILLEESGFFLINDRKSQLIEQMKTLVVDKIHYSSDEPDVKWPDYIKRVEF